MQEPRPAHSDLPNLVSLARMADEVAADWRLELGSPFALARYSFVAPVGADTVLKLTPAEDDESDEEPDALELWAGNAAVRLLRRDPARRALLLERATPGTDLAAVPEDEALNVAVDVGRRLWAASPVEAATSTRSSADRTAPSNRLLQGDVRPPESPSQMPFRWIGDHVPRWLDNAERGGRAGSELIPLARELYASLDVGRETLVHGDFRHHNILRSDRGWLAIDPKPMLGEPEYDVPSFLWNPLPYRMGLATTERRIAAFVAAGLDDWRIRAWTVIRGSYLGAEPDEVAVIRALL